MNIKNHIYNDSEIKLLKLISRVGFYTNIYNKDIDVSYRTIASCIKEELIEFNKVNILFSNQCTIYKLTEKGKRVVKSIFLIDPYKSSSQQIEHDYILGKIYLNLSEDEQESWATETTLLMLYPNERTVDATYINKDNKVVGVEVITDNYSKDMIDNKIRFIKKYCDDDIVINAKDIYRKSDF